MGLPRNLTHSLRHTSKKKRFGFFFIAMQMFVSNKFLRFRGRKGSKETRINQPY